MRHTLSFVLVVLATALTVLWGSVAADAESLDSEIEPTLRSLYETTPAAKDLASKAAGILVFPDVFRDGNLVRIQSGNGALLVGGRIAGYYTASSIAYGLQPGALSFASVVFLMTNSALSRLEQNAGWDVGKDPAVVIMPAGTPEMPHRTTNTQTGTMDATSGTLAARTRVQPDTYVFVLGDTGLLTGVGREGWRIIKAAP